MADFMEFAELMCRDALEREESCGGHFRAEYQTEDGEAKRDDERFATWPPGSRPATTRRPVRHVEPLAFENVQLATRSYK